MKALSIVLSFSLFLCFTISNAYSIDSKLKDCITCNPKDLPGTPNLEKIDKLSSIVTKGVYQNINIEGYHQSYCLRFEHVSNTYMFKKEILESMKKTPYSLEKYWTQLGCTPKFIGATDSPLIHLVAEDVAGKTQFLLYLHKYLLEQKEEKTWLKLINAKNSRGHTLLDYVIYLANKDQYIPEEIEAVNNLIKVVCEKGATFSVFADKKCPTTIGK